MGDYQEIETWIAEGRVDCGFLRLPTQAAFDTIFLEQDPLLVVLPEGHPLAALEKITPKALAAYPFMMLEKDGQADAAAVFAAHCIQPQVRFKTWDDYAIMSMVESGLGISILPKLILQRIPYRIVTRELTVPAYRDIGIAVRKQKNMTAVVERFLAYQSYR